MNTDPKAETIRIHLDADTLEKVKQTQKVRLHNSGSASEVTLESTKVKATTFVTVVIFAIVQTAAVMASWYSLCARIDALDTKWERKFASVDTFVRDRTADRFGGAHEAEVHRALEQKNDGWVGLTMREIRRIQQDINLSNGTN